MCCAVSISRTKVIQADLLRQRYDKFVKQSRALLGRHYFHCTQPWRCRRSAHAGTVREPIKQRPWRSCVRRAADCACCGVGLQQCDCLPAELPFAELPGTQRTRRTPQRRAHCSAGMLAWGHC